MSPYMLEQMTHLTAKDSVTQSKEAKQLPKEFRTA